MRVLRLGQSLNAINSGVSGVNNFVFSVNTNAAGSSSTQFQLPLVSSDSISMNVDWGDGTKDIITEYNQAETLHDYASTGGAGVYTIKISNEVKGWRFANSGDKAKLNLISNWGGFNFTDSGAFWGCTNMTSTAIDTPTVSSTNMSYTFRSCSSFNGVMNSFNVSSVTNISNMLRGATSFDQPLDKWNISSITNMTNFLTGGSLSTANYDTLLIGWEEKSPNTGLVVNFGASKYTLGSAAETAKQDLLGVYSWTITDGGGI